MCDTTTSIDIWPILPVASLNTRIQHFFCGDYFKQIYPKLHAKEKRVSPKMNVPLCAPSEHKHHVNANDVINECKDLLGRTLQFLFLCRRIKRRAWIWIMSKSTFNACHKDVSAKCCKACGRKAAATCSKFNYTYERSYVPKTSRQIVCDIQNGCFVLSFSRSDPNGVKPTSAFKTKCRNSMQGCWGGPF